MKTTTHSALIAVSFGILALLPGCRIDECVANTNCDCIGGNCEILCGGKSKAGCDMHCSEGAECILDCPGGSCNLDCNGAASCEMKCGKGSCNLTCANTPSCQITTCHDTCELVCGGADVCGGACGPAQSCFAAP